MIDLAPNLLRDVDTSDSADLWTVSGAAALTGRPSGPPLAGPVGAAPSMRALAAQLRLLSAGLGCEVHVDGPSLLVERASITGHRRQGTISCGGASRLVRASDGWLAVSLARDEDLASVPAWLEVDVDTDDVVAVERMIATAIAERTVAEVVERASLLGIPCGALREVRHGSIPAVALGAAEPLTNLEGLVVLDLSSLWAGPLCGRLLAAAGATVIKVESSTRPDGARRGPQAFFDLMNAGKESVLLDLSSRNGQWQLAEMVGTADVVIEASRPRALQQMGIDARAFPGRVWLSITAYGHDQPMRVGFGDDAAVAGGLVAWDEQGPVFAADAAADPITGLFGAVAVLDRLVAGERWFVDLSLAHAAALVSNT